MPAMRAAEENVLHFILQCEKLQSEIVALLFEINAIWQNEFQNNENFTDLSEVDQLQLLMDNTIKVKPTKKNSIVPTLRIKYVCCMYWKKLRRRITV
jgi:hypothetical protein